MKKTKSLFLILLFGCLITQTKAQTITASNQLVAQQIPNRTVLFDISEEGVSTPIIWGLDLAWLSETNIRRGIAFMGIDRIGVVRSSFTPTAPLIDGELQAAELKTLNERLRIIKLLGANTKVVLNSDHPSVDPWFAGNARHWAQLIDVTARLHEEQGRTVITVSPFNEPDYSATGQGTISDFYEIAGELKKNPRFDNIRISGGNTLNTDKALEWYNTLKDRLDEGNTHQLAGNFDNYADFFTTVRANGHHATNDELHNVMEAMVGVEYGLQTGIWWGTAEYARGEFVKASYGKRLGYAEHRPNWTAASVYRSPEGKVQAFGGTSERQAATTTYRFVSKDRDVYYDGYGPQREYILEMPGGTGYQQGQTNAERVVNITWGDDIQPVINGTYILVNRNSHKAMEVAGGLMNAGTKVRQNSYTGAKYQQWNVTPVDSRIGGDFSYFTFTAVHSNKALDLPGWSLENGSGIQVWDNNKNDNQQWYLEYVEDGWFYIRNRYSAKCMEVAGSSTAQNANIQQQDIKGTANQQWRFLPVGVPVEFEAPEAPANLFATAHAASIQLDWSANPETDVEGYTIFRSESADEPYNTIARDVRSTSFVDNTSIAGKQYFYAIKAVDKSLNRSPFSNQVSAKASGNNAQVLHLSFDADALDDTENLNHGAVYGSARWVDGKIGSKAISMDGTQNFIQLPASIANHNEITIATWVYWRGGATWQRIFDFGNSESENMFLTTSNSDLPRKLRFAIKNGDAEQYLDAPVLPANQWSHVAVTMGTSGVKIYTNGELVAASNAFTIKPMDFKPVLNYIGRSQYSNPLFKGYIDDFMVFNYELSADEITNIVEKNSGIAIKTNHKKSLHVWPLPAKDILHINYNDDNNNPSTILLYNINGQLVKSQDMQNNDTIEWDVSDLPSGMYILKLINNEESLVKKIHIVH